MRCLPFLAIFLVLVSAQEEYKLCVTDKVNEDTCHALQRGNSRVSCLRVTDSAECAIRLESGEADFGVFNAEELLLAYKFYPNEIVPIYQLRHKDRINEEFQFQSVAVTPSSVKPQGHANEFQSIKNGGLCHPGFSAAQWWNDYILKYFERKIAASDCQDDLTVAENEAENIKKFFGTACRPGEWSTESSLDDTLKKKYPELCELCDNKEACTYSKTEKHGHLGALDCLLSGRGKVAYVALSYVRDYIQTNDSYQFLCTDGTTQPLSTAAPCAWIQQPWGVIAARKSIASSLAKSLNKWLTTPFASESWTISLNLILQEDSKAVALTENTSLVSYLSKGREVDLPNSQTCKGDPLRWCTIGNMETQKCKWVAREVKALGIEPNLCCKNASSTFECFHNIANNEADIMTIDSNYGHLARTVYGLTTMLYSETESEKNSVVYAVTKEKSENPIKSLESLEGRKACFPEYGGIAWMSFIHVARTNGIINPKSCDYPELVASFFSNVCAPGVTDADHLNRTKGEERLEITNLLCSSCMTQENGTCAANESNFYFGDMGALECLNKGDGDVAFIEARNLYSKNQEKKDIARHYSPYIDPKEYRILCKNGTLANSPGFNVDGYCAFSVTIDSEVVGRRNNSEIETLNTVAALLKIENWLGYRAKVHRPIRIYDKFNNTTDLMFKDSSSGLVDAKSNIPTVLAYKELFEHIDTCSGAGLTIISNLGLIALATIFAVFFSRTI